MLVFDLASMEWFSYRMLVRAIRSGDGFWDKSLSLNLSCKVFSRPWCNHPPFAPWIILLSSPLTCCHQPFHFSPPPSWTFFPFFSSEWTELQLFWGCPFFFSYPLCCHLYYHGAASLLPVLALLFLILCFAKVHTLCFCQRVCVCVCVCFTKCVRPSRPVFSPQSLSACQNNPPSLCASAPCFAWKNVLLFPRLE